MSMVSRYMKEDAECRGALRKMYPGLPYYNMLGLFVMKCMSGMPHSIKPSSVSPNIVAEAEKWEKKLAANSSLASRLGSNLDWIYETEEALYYSEHIDLFKSRCALFKGEMHTLEFILSYLVKNHSNLSFTSEGRSLEFECWREEIDASFRWEPTIKRIFYKETVVPNSMDEFSRMVCMRREGKETEAD